MRAVDTKCQEHRSAQTVEPRHLQLTSVSPHPRNRLPPASRFARRLGITMCLGRVRLPYPLRQGRTRIAPSSFPTRSILRRERVQLRRIPLLLPPSSSQRVVSSRVTGEAVRGPVTPSAGRVECSRTHLARIRLPLLCARVLPLVLVVDSGRRRGRVRHLGSCSCEVSRQEAHGDSWHRARAPRYSRRDSFRPHRGTERATRDRPGSK